MKYKFSCKKGNKYLIKMILDNDKEVWAETEEKVSKYAKKNFTENEECGFEYTEENGQYNVTKILKQGQGTTKKTETKTDSEYTCEECGTALKDGKYRKCYKCNNKKTSSSGGGGYTGDYMRPKTPEESDRIMKLSLMETASIAMAVMTGSIQDIDTLGDMLIILYEKMLAKVKE